MNVTFRPSVPADAAAIRALLTNSGLKPNVEVESLDWKYWLHREDWSTPRSFVAARGAEVLAHAAVVPGRCATPTGRLTILHLIDWAAHPAVTGLGSSLMKHIGRMADALLAVGGSEQTLRILPHIGFKPCGTADGYVRALHPLRHLGVSRTAWKLPARIARRTVWRMRSPLAEPLDWRARRISTDDLPQLAEALPTGSSTISVLERSTALFRYWLRCPIVPMELYALDAGSRTIGYFLLTFAPGQARLADCWATTDEPGAWHALLQHAAVHASQHGDVAELVAWSSDTIMSRALADCGFHHRTQQPVLLRCSSTNTRIAGQLRVQMIDNDAAFLHSGRAELWA